MAIKNMSNPDFSFNKNLKLTYDILIQTLKHTFSSHRNLSIENTGENAYIIKRTT